MANCHSPILPLCHSNESMRRTGCRDAQSSPNQSHNISCSEMIRIQSLLSLLLLLLPLGTAAMSLLMKMSNLLWFSRISFGLSHKTATLPCPLACVRLAECPGVALSVAFCGPCQSRLIAWLCTSTVASWSLHTPCEDSTPASQPSFRRTSTGLTTLIPLCIVPLSRDPRPVRPVIPHLIP